MPAPQSPTDARVWARKAFFEDRYNQSRHFDERRRERRMLMRDVEGLIRRCQFPEPYPDMPKNGGSLWRIQGMNIDGTAEIAIGIELFDRDGLEWMCLVTIFEVSVKR